MSQRFEILNKVRREYTRFNTVGTQLTAGLNPPPVSETNPVDHFVAIVNELFEHSLKDVRDGYMVGVAIHNDVNQNDIPVGISFRLRDQLPGDLVWSVK